MRAMAKRISFRVHGQVQGVGFRYFTRKKAASYNLTGWCRNTSKGEVEGEAQGDEDGIQKLLTDLNRGPSHALVSKLDKSDIEIVDVETAFEVRR